MIEVFKGYSWSTNFGECFVFQGFIKEMFLET
jgi:hypothetical protein